MVEVSSSASKIYLYLYDFALEIIVAVISVLIRILCREHLIRFRQGFRYNYDMHLLTVIRYHLILSREL